MAAELEQFANQLEQRGYPEAAVAIRKQIPTLQEEYNLPDTLKIKREKAINPRVEEITELANQLNEKFGASADGNIRLLELRLYENDNWNKALKDLGISGYNRSLIRSALGSAARHGIRTIAAVRMRNLPGEEPLYTITSIGDIRAAFLENVFTPKKAEEK